MHSGHTDIQTTQIYAKILNSKITTEVNMVKQNLNDLNKFYSQRDILLMVE